MKKLLSISFLFLMFALVASAKSDDKTAVFTVSPKMSCQNCENKIKSNLRFEKGVKQIVTSLADQTVTITYSPEKTTPEKIANGFKKIGYTPTLVDANGKPVCDKNARQCTGTSGSCNGTDSCCQGEKKDTK